MLLRKKINPLKPHMMINNQSIPCPVCQSSIPFSIDQLLMGIHFACSNPECTASISLASESKPIVEETMEKFKEIELGNDLPSL